MKQKIKKHYKKAIVGILILTVVMFISHLYGIFIEPFIQPYFFKLGNIDRIVGEKVGSNVTLLEYDIDTNPTYEFSGTKGISRIYASVQLMEKATFDSLKEKLTFDTEKYLDKVKEYKNSHNYILHIDDADEIYIRYYTASVYRKNYYGLFKFYESPGPSIGVYIVLTRYDTAYRLYVFTDGEEDILY